MSDISSFTMRGTNATLLCAEKFNFTAIEHVYLGGISFVNCGGRSSIFEWHVLEIGNFTLENSNFRTDEPFYTRSTGNILISSSTFTNSPRGVFSISSTLILQIRDCLFADNVQASSSSDGVISSSGARSLVTIENSIFKNNRMISDFTSGGFEGSGQSLTITNSAFVNNTGGRLGAGAVYSGYESVVISGSTFRDNTGVRGAGAVTIGAVRNNVAVISQSMFLNNTAFGSSLLGGAVYVASDRSSITIRQSTFMNNNGTQGGALGFATDNSSILVDWSNFVGNTVHNRGNGGAIEALGSNVSIHVKQSLFTHNQVEGSGGALSLQGDLPIITINQSQFFSNVANDAGGAINVFYSQQRNNAELMISNSVFSENSATSCGAFGVTVSLFRRENKLRSRNVQIETSEFRSNRETGRQFGSGAMCISYTNASIAHSKFSNNSGPVFGGVLTMEQGRISVEGSVFHNNKAGRDGGVVYGRINFTGVFNRSVIMRGTMVG